MLDHGRNDNDDDVAAENNVVVAIQDDNSATPVVHTNMGICSTPNDSKEKRDSVQENRKDNDQDETALVDPIIITVFIINFNRRRSVSPLQQQRPIDVFGYRCSGATDVSCLVG